MGTLVRNIGYSAQSTRIKRSQAVLSNGSSVHFLIDMNNTTDNDNIDTFAKIYHKPVDGAVVLKNTIIFDAAYNAQVKSSIAIDQADNLHVVVAINTRTSFYPQLMYYKGTHAVGPTWTFSAPVILQAALSSDYYETVDIDVSGIGDNPVIVSASSTNQGGTNPITSRVKVYGKLNNGSWVTLATNTVTNGFYSEAGDVSIAARNTSNFGIDSGEGAPNNHLIFSQAGRTNTGTDPGDSIWSLKINFIDGTATKTQMLGPLNAGKNLGFRRYWCFFAGNSGGDHKFVVAAISQSATWEIGVAAFSLNSIAAGKQDLIIYTNYPSKTNTLALSGTSRDNQVSISYNSADSTFVFIANNTADDSSSCQVVKLDLNLNEMDSPNAPKAYEADYQYTYKYNSVGPKEFFGGAQSRNTSYVSIYFLMTYFSGSGNYGDWRIEYHKPLLPRVPPWGDSQLIPANGSTVTTDLPKLSVGMNAQTDAPPYYVRANWQLASDSGFTTNLRNIIFDDKPLYGFSNFDNTDDRGATVEDFETLDAEYELFQNIWYIRARIEDKVGGRTAWGPANSFTISHLPAASNLSPTGDAVLIYGTSGQVTFAWIFTDPSPTDSQSAYQIIIENNGTGAIILDTQKVISTSQSTVLVIPVESKDQTLRWRIRLWDSDNIQGPDSGQQLFYVTDPPLPVITSPTDGETITTAVPSINWTAGLGVGESQISYRLSVKQGGVTVYTTNWVSSSATTVSIPTGILQNNSAYTIELSVRDNYNLEGTTSIAVNTEWALPAAPSEGAVYLSEYNKWGFVYITVLPVNASPDFVSFNLYRRKYGQANWELLETWYDPTFRMAYRDFMVGSNETYQYAVTQLISYVGDLLESEKFILRTVIPQSDRYWLTYILDIASNNNRGIPLSIVTADSFSEDWEQETYNVIGRGQHVDYGERIGFNGSLNASLRDIAQGGISRVNSISNPSMVYRIGSNSTPESWIWSINGTHNGYIEDYPPAGEPSPAGRTECYRTHARAQGPTVDDWVQIAQTISKDNLPVVTTGQTVTFSVWIYDTGELPGTRIMMEAQNADDLVLGVPVSVLNPAVVELYLPNPLPPSHPDYPAISNPGIWKRVSCSIVWPAEEVDHLVIRIRREAGNGDVYLYLTGAQVEAGAMTPYFDGYQFGSEWLGEEFNSPSFTTGYYTARQQRLDIEELKAKRVTAYLRNPFGDIWLVAAGNVAVSRVPGVGSSEFTDITIPYSEVAF